MTGVAVTAAAGTRRNLHGSVKLGEHSARLLGVPEGTVLDLGLLSSTDDSLSDKFSEGLPDLTSRKGRKRARRMYAGQIAAARANAGWD